LHNLLLHHGRRSYWRLTLMVSYFFYKNVFITTVLFWHQFFAGFSGQRLFDDYFQVRPKMKTALQLALALYRGQRHRAYTLEHPVACRTRP
jgi:magnesium-transporting ATPase (P-type)